MSDWTDDYIEGLPDSFGGFKYVPKPKKVRATLSAKFNVGDTVRLKFGTAPIKVTEVNGTYVSGDYVHSGKSLYHRNQNDFVKYDGESKMTTNTNKLYTWKDPVSQADLYGHYLATNSQGEWVMEVKGSSHIMAMTKDKIQEVLPYTIGVKFGKGGQTYHYLAEKDKFPVGFYLTESYAHDNFQIAQVVQVDTKSPKATVEFKPFGKLAVDLY